MATNLVQNLSFRFPDSWESCKYDDWSFYRNQFCRMRTGIKAVDLLAVSPDRTVWLIEVKDYRTNPRTKPTELAEEVGMKAFDTIAAMIPAKINANEGSEAQFAARVISGLKLRVVLHLEQPLKHSKLFPKAIRPADVLMKLRVQVKPIDPHPLVLDMGSMADVAWSVV